MLHRAIRELYANVVVIYGDTVEDVVAKDSDMKEVTLVADDINAKITELETEYDNLQYARDRAAAYPSTKEFIEAYTEKEIGEDSTKWDAYVVKYNQVRTDNPKE
tara:strand:+ start:851 stop:1165 length:315 start_codon:yes stop_codon:yes gene_type:complete